MSKKRIIIVGGGFAGVKCAGTLTKKLSGEDYEIVLFNSENYMVFQPLLAEVVGSSITPESVAVPLRQMLPKVTCRTEDITLIDLKSSFVRYLTNEGYGGDMYYDHLVISVGSEVNLGIIPGMADHSFPLRTVGDAITLRYHVMEQLENAEVCDDYERKRWYLSFIVVGGGFSGVEVAGEINDLVKDSARYYKNFGKDDFKVILIHSRDQILPEVTSKLRDFAKDKMEKAGITVKLSKRVTYVTPEGVGLKDGSLISGATVVCTVGNTTSAIIKSLDIEKEKGRVVTSGDMKVIGFENVWAIGDCAKIVNTYNNEESPPTGQFAERQGRQTAQNIIRSFEGKETKPFYFRPIGQLCAIGGHNAVAELFGLHLSGFIAWYIWRTVYILKLPSISHRVKVGFDWAWEFFYSRDLSHPKVNLTERISRAYFRPGDLIIEQDDPSMNFYIIESGEVEVFKANQNGGTKTIAILGPGDFFGEMALISDRPRSASVKARSEVEVTIMGKKVFDQISSTLKPFRDFVFDAFKRRSPSIWQRMPAALDIIKSYPLSAFIEPVSIILKSSSTFEETVQKISEGNSDFCCVIDDGNRLKGVVTRTDIFRAIDRGVANPIRVKEFMMSEPIVVSENESTVLVIDTMRDHNLKWMPVVDNVNNMKLKGIVRRDKMLSFVLANLHKTTVKK